MNTLSQRIAGHYLIQKNIGSGAMGDVYLALDERLDRPVAVKVLKLEADSVEAREHFILRFRQEARTIARLTHPNIVALYDLGTEADRFYMVMEYVQGRNLQQLIEGRTEPLPVAQTLRIAIQLCDALARAHESDVVHRDVKPANILVSSRGEVKLTDFGIARLSQAQDMRLTQAGTMLGSFLYAAPEQLTNAAEADTRADIYSVGATIYELLTGQPAYQADNIGRLIQLIFTQDPTPPQILNEEVPEAFAEIIWKALAKNPLDRYQRMSEMLADLQKLSGMEISVMPMAATVFEPISEPERDTRTTQVRFNLLKTTTQSGARSILKYLRGNQAWLSHCLADCEASENRQSYSEVRARIRQHDLRGKCFSGVLEFGDHWVFVADGDICGAYYTLEGLTHDAALERLPETAMMHASYALSPGLSLSLASFVALDGQAIQENLDSALLNLFPILDELVSEAFEGYGICRRFEGDDEEPIDTHVYLFEQGLARFSFRIDSQGQFGPAQSSLAETLGRGRCLLSLYAPARQVMATVMRDLLALAELKPTYHDPHDGVLADVLQLAAGDMSHCLGEAIGANLTFELSLQGQSTLPEAFRQSLEALPDYQSAHWLMTELFFGINAHRQIQAFKDLYPRFAQIQRLRFHQDLPSEFGCAVRYSLIAEADPQAAPVLMARRGNGDPADIELFVEETIAVQKSLLQQGLREVPAAVYVSDKPLGNQALAQFARLTLKPGLFSKLKGFVKVQGKAGFHLFLAEHLADTPPRLLAPGLL